MRPRGRIRVPSQQSSSNTAFNFDQYPQQYYQGNYRANNMFSEASNSKWTRDIYYDQYPAYNSGSAAHSNFESNHYPTGPYSAGMGRGGGLIDTELRNCPPGHQPHVDNRTKPRKPRINQLPSRNSNYEKGNKTDNKHKSRNPLKQPEKISSSIVHICPNCKLSYNSNIQQKVGSKMPLILHCGHTMCQDCIYQGLNDNKITCPSCSIDSTLTKEQFPSCQSDLQNVFLPNFYILGILLYSRVAGDCIKKMENLSFVGTGCNELPPAAPSPIASDACCFGDCLNKATMYCSNCEGFYCYDCCTVVHKSTKKLMSHAPESICKKEFSFMLENCKEHPKMQIEFFCKTCDLGACCYCVLDQHTDHERVALYSLNDAEMKEFKKRKRAAKEILKEVLSAQKQASKLANFDTADIKKTVLHYFSDYHAKLECLENKVFNQLENFKFTNGGLNDIQSSLQKQAEELQQLVSFNEENIDEKKMNLRVAFNKLLNVGDTPRFLLNKSNEISPISFVANYNNLDEDIFIKKCEEYEYQLVPKNKLPQDYVFENETDNESDSKLNSLVNSVEVLTQKSTGQDSTECHERKSTLKQVVTNQKHSGFEKVEVQHINSLESFFIQYKKDQSKLGQLNKDIENYVRMGGAESVTNPQRNALYLALYITESVDCKEQKWCRARLTEIKPSNDVTLYEMFFIDYGKVQIVGGNRIRDIPVNLAQKKPFAIECMLHNPMDVTWRKDAHYSLAKLLIEKEVVMMEKSYSHGICQVDLMIASSDGGATSVSDILIHAHHSVANSNDDSISLDESQSSTTEVYYPALKIFSNSNTFAKNQKEKVVIVNVVDPYNIFVHMVKNEDAMKNMNREIKKAYKSCKSGGCIPIEGTYALVEYRGFMKPNWHRALIKRVDINIDSVHVLLVDWGINVVVSINKIRPLQKSITRVESQAVLVKLAHIAPTNMQSVWASNATNFLQTYQRSQDVLKMIVQDVRPDVEVALFDTNHTVDMCLNAMMVEHNLADSTGHISTQVEWPRFQPDNPEFPTEDGLMSRLLKKVDEEAKIDDDSDGEDFSAITKKRVDVVKVESPQLIWLKFLHFKDREREMFKNLQVHYSQDRQTQTEWQVGTLCVTEIGNEYVRGKISELVGNDYKIYLVDKVKYITVPIDKIYKYDEYFARYQQAVVKCHLANIRPAGDTGNWSISSVEALQEIFRTQNRLYAALVNNEASDIAKSSLSIDMWYGLIIRGGPLDPDKLKYVSIANSLVKLGFAFKLNQTVSTNYTAQDALLKGITNVQTENSEEKSSNLSESKRKTWYEEVLEADESQANTTQPEKISDKDKLSENEDDDVDDDEENKSVDGNSTCTKNLEEISDWLPSFKISERDFQAKITCVESGGHLYIHTEPLDEAYYKMEANIKKYFDTHFPIITDQIWQPGDLCTIKFTDENWYRGKVLKVLDPQKVAVYMIDFGSDHHVSTDNIFREVLYTEIRAFATKCKLDKVYAKSGAWLTSDYDHFHGLVTDWCRIIVKGSLDVELPMVEVYNDEHVFVNQRLIELCPNLSRSSNVPEESIDDDNLIIIENIEIEELCVSNDEATNEPIDSTSELAEKIYSERAIENDILEYKIQELPRELLCGEKVEMIIGGILDNNRICIRLVDVNTTEEFYDLINAIQDDVAYRPKLISYTIGKPCIGQFSEDKMWYRAKIISDQTAKSGLVKVMFVDYGNYEAVSMDSIKDIRPEDMEIPQQCWEVGLNIELNDGVDPSSIKNVLDAFDRKTVYVKLVSKNPITVDLYGKSGALLYDTMIKTGNVKPLYSSKS